MSAKQNTASRQSLVTRNFMCPECCGPISYTPERICCSACDRSWPVVDGVPYFISDFPYWGELPQQLMTEVNRRAAVEGWRTALTDTSDATILRAAEMILNLERANWQWLPELSDDSHVLDIGAGCGTNSHSLALHFREVTAVEPVAERIDFMRMRFAQEGLRNVHLLRSSIWTLPFQPATFDMAAMNGVLEWVPLGRTEDPREVQLEALRSIHKLLRPGGYIYIGVENRYAAGHFVGYRDPHCGLPWVTVAPRPVAHWLARRQGQPGYRNYLYGSRGYRKLLMEAGFTEYQPFLALPSYNYPRYLIPLDRKMFSYYAHAFNPGPPGRLRRIAHRALLKTGLLGHLEYSFALIARKGAS